MLYATTLIMALSCLGLSHGASVSHLPSVDLGYQVHRAFSLDSSSHIYNFSNIPYAEPPLGPLRFRASIPPQGRKKGVQDGKIGKVCPQAVPIWQDIGSFPVKNDPRTTEDCLVLDVLVPKGVLESSKEKRKPQARGAPVLVWIFGGGYVFGTKDLWGDPTGLIEASQDDGSPGIVYVAINYRVGAFGFLAGSTLQQNGTANAGLYDQRLAIEWVRDNIAKFGGDPENITIMGQSAGGGSVMHQITAFANERPVTFQKAIPQSPGLFPLPGPQQQEVIFQDFLSILNVSSVGEARQLSSETLINANLKHVGDAPYGTYVYGPAVDGEFVTGIPSKLFLQGAYDKNIPILSSDVAHEGDVFTDTTITTEDQVPDFIRRYFPNISHENLEYVIKTLYPPIYDGSYPYTSIFERLALFLGESTFSCNRNVMLNAAAKHGTPAYGYQFSIPPALHGYDLGSTFYSGGQGVDVKTAQQIQHYITNFAKTGSPNSGDKSSLSFPQYGSEYQIMDFNTTETLIRDPTETERCIFWQKALYY